MTAEWLVHFAGVILCDFPLLTALVVVIWLVWYGTVIAVAIIVAESLGWCWVATKCVFAMLAVAAGFTFLTQAAVIGAALFIRYTVCCGDRDGDLSMVRLGWTNLKLRVDTRVHAENGIARV